MPTTPPPRRWTFPRTRVSKAEADRRARHAEDYYRKQGYSAENAEAETQKDFELVQMIRKRRRSPGGLDRFGTPN